MIKNCLIAAVFIFGVCAPVHAATYTVTLTNGNTIQANSYRVEKGKVILKYPVGEGAFNISQVASIMAEGGSVNLLQAQGELKPAEKKAAPADAKNAKLPFDPEAMKKNVKEHLKRAKEAAEQRAANGQAPPYAKNPDPQRDALIDLLEKTEDKTQRAEIEKKLFDDIPESTVNEPTNNKVLAGPRGGGR